MSSNQSLIIVIPTRNRAHLAQRAIKSILDQDHDGIHVLVSDNSTVERDANLSNLSVNKLLRVLQKRFKYAIITNDISHEERSGWRNGWKGTRIKPNCDIADGAYRPLKLTDAPFNINARRLGLIPFDFVG
jgi:glycosyltransferase involved in cell wall biosynthesis